MRARVYVCVCASQQAGTILKISWLIYMVSSGFGAIPFMTKVSERSVRGQPSLMTLLVPAETNAHTQVLM